MTTTAIVVNFNGERWIDRCLGSLPVSPDVEIVVVDNGSTDGSVDLVRKRHPSACILALGENLGFGAANNRGEEIAAGDRLLLLNPDAWLDEGSLPKLHAALDDSPRVAAVAPALRDEEGRPEFSWYPECGVLGEAIQIWRNSRSRSGRGWIEGLLRRLLAPGWLTAACLLVRRDAFRDVGGFDEGFFLYFEDVDLCRRLTRRGWRLREEPAAGAVHIGSVGLREERRDGAPGRASLEYRVSQLRYYRKHRPRWEVAVLRRRLRRRFGGRETPTLLREGILAALDRDRREARGLW